MRIRRQFKISIGKMEGIEEPLARIAGNAYVMDAAASLITYGIMLGENPPCCRLSVSHITVPTAGSSRLLMRWISLVAKALCSGKATSPPVLTEGTDCHHR